MIVNLGEDPIQVVSCYGGEVELPQWGFVIDAPTFAAFYANQWGGLEYPGGSMFSLTALDGEHLELSQRVRVFHGFGEIKLRWREMLHVVERERFLEL